MTDRSGFSIASAAREELADVAELAAALRAPTTEPSLPRGYLVADYSQADYRRFVDGGARLWVARQDEVVGFLLAYLCDSDFVDPPLRRELEARSLLDAWICKQVGVAERVAGMGVGRRLYRELFDLAGARPVLAAIVAEPPNLPSETFHGRLGFQPLFRFVPTDGRLRSVWIREV